jgi:nitrite reductase/ring-hydroxylating ferredoxin subunit
LKIGIDHAPEDTEIKTDGYQAIMPADQLPENRLYRAQLNNVPLVLLRRGERVYALATTCAHLGGPLDEGSLERGPQGQLAVICPWHGSRFNMQTGEVLNGPSAYPEPCFDAHIRDGQVEVRHLIE